MPKNILNGEKTADLLFLAHENLVFSKILHIFAA